MGKRTAQKDAIKDTSSDSQVNSCFPYRWPPASLNIKHLFLPIFVLIYNKHNDKYRNTTSKTTKEPKQKSRLRTASNKILVGGGGGELNEFPVDQPSSLILPWFIRQNNYNKSITPQNKNKPLNQINSNSSPIYTERNK